MAHMVAAEPKNLRVWVDTDLALGAVRGDVDDGFALAWLLSRRELQVEGISLVSGNTDAETARRCAEQLVAAAGCAPPPLLAGAAAAAALAALGASVRLLAIGPLSNLAAALQRSPQTRWFHVVAVGGLHRRWLRPWLAASDLNRGRDRPAWDRVSAAQTLLRVPLYQARRLRADAALLQRLAVAPGLGPYLATHSQRWWRSAPWRHGARSFPLWDLVAAMWMLDALPGAVCVEGVLVDFDPAAARERFLADLGA
jgi:inosine-uridine nucleoside N-ribohydrolase